MNIKDFRLIKNVLSNEGLHDQSVSTAIEKAIDYYVELKENDYDINTLRSIAERVSSFDYTTNKLSKIILSSVLIVYKDFYINGVLAVFHIDSLNDLHLLFNLMDAMKKHKMETQAQINQRSVHQLNTDESTKLKQENKQLKEDIEKIKQLYLSTSEKLNSAIKELHELKEKLASVQPISDQALKELIEKIILIPSYEEAKGLLDFLLENGNLFSPSQQETIRHTLFTIKLNFHPRNQPILYQTNNISGCNVMQGDINLNKEN